jgi:hypothetical protein
MAGYIGSKSSVTQVDGYSEAEADAEFVNDPNGAITVSGSNVGIGTSSPATGLDVTTSNYTYGGTNYDIYGILGLTGGGVRLGGDSTNSDSVIGTTGTGDMQFVTYNGSAWGSRMTLDNTGNVGIGTSSPAYKFEVSDGSRTAIINPNSVLDGIFIGTKESKPLVLGTGDAERMRINGSGEILIGKTSAASSTVGAQIIAGGISQFGRSGAEALRLTRTTNNGDILQFQRNDTLVGSIGTDTTFGKFTIAGSNNSGIFFTSNAMLPIGTTGAIQDDTVDLGNAGVRFDDIFATNGTIQTSDATEKQDIASLTATEMLVGKRISAFFKTFRWKDSVAEKGDNARTHTGVIAQDVQAAFTAEGLDAGDYALFISSTWWEHDVDVPAVEAVEAVEAVTETTTDEDGNEVVTVITEAVEAVEAKDAYTRTDTYDTEDEAPEGATERTRLGIRYPELLSFVAAYNEQRFASIEARLTALEA